MKFVGYIFWQDDGAWLGYLEDFPDYTTQGTSLDDLKEHLADLRRELASGVIAGARQHAMLEVG